MYGAKQTNKEYELIQISKRRRNQKIAILFLVLLLTICLVASPVSAKGENAKGAVKADIVEFFGRNPSPPPPFLYGDIVGSVIFNTTANGKLIVNVNMDATPDLEDYDVIVSICYNPPLPGQQVIIPFDDVLNTNAQGQGNALVMVDINPPSTNDSIWVSVSVREGPANPPQIPVFPPLHNAAAASRSTVKVTPETTNTTILKQQRLAGLQWSASLWQLG